MLIDRNGLRQKVLDSGVHCVLPWYRSMMPLYDALAGMKERGEWDRPEVVTGVGVASATTRTGDVGVLRGAEGLVQSGLATSSTFSAT